MLSEELSTLKEIYLEEFSVINEGACNKIQVKICPATGEKKEEQFVFLTLELVISDKYPEELPELAVRNPRGLGDDDVNSLLDKLKAIASEKRGQTMLYDIIECAKDSLTKDNIPHGECAICLETFHANQPFQKTKCFHYFHVFCLQKYMLGTTSGSDQQTDSDIQQENTVHQTSKETVCPICREALDITLDQLNKLVSVDSQLANTIEETQATIAEMISSPEIQEIQTKMQEMFVHQLEKGGIIDAEAEARKLILTPGMTVTLPVSSTPVSEPTLPALSTPSSEPTSDFSVKNDQSSSQDDQPDSVKKQDKSENQRSKHDHERPPVSSDDNERSKYISSDGFEDESIEISKHTEASEMQTNEQQEEGRIVRSGNRGRGNRNRRYPRYDNRYHNQRGVFRRKVPVEKQEDTGEEKHEEVLEGNNNGDRNDERKISTQGQSGKESREKPLRRDSSGGSYWKKMRERKKQQKQNAKEKDDQGLSGEGNGESGGLSEVEGDSSSVSPTGDSETVREVRQVLKKSTKTIPRPSPLKKTPKPSSVKEGDKMLNENMDEAGCKEKNNDDAADAVAASDEKNTQTKRKKRKNRPRKSSSSKEAGDESNLRVNVSRNEQRKASTSSGEAIIQGTKGQRHRNEHENQRSSAHDIYSEKHNQAKPSYNNKRNNKYFEEQYYYEENTSGNQNRYSKTNSYRYEDNYVKGYYDGYYDRNRKSYYPERDYDTRGYYDNYQRQYDYQYQDGWYGSYSHQNHRYRYDDRKTGREFFEELQRQQKELPNTGKQVKGVYNAESARLAESTDNKFIEKNQSQKSVNRGKNVQGRFRGRGRHHNKAKYTENGEQSRLENSTTHGTEIPHEKAGGDDSHAHKSSVDFGEKPPGIQVNAPPSHPD